MPHDAVSGSGGYGPRAAEEGDGMGSQHAVAAEEEYLSDQERRRRRLDDPEVKARIAEIKAENEAPDSAERPGISAEELPDFLREQRQRR